MRRSSSRKPSIFQELLEKLALALESAGIPYMVIGGQAVLLYGEPRLTRGVDVSLGADAERIREVLDLVLRLGWRVLVEEPGDFVRRTMVLPCDDPQSGVRVDLTFSFNPYERQALERVKMVAMGKAIVRFTSVEDLIIHKIIAGRPRDLEDIKGVLLKNRGLDEVYIRNWLRECQDSLSEPLLQRFDAARTETF
ncbi:MAG: nucleotidyltransferase [Acidobacteriota bacterium]